MFNMISQYGFICYSTDYPEQPKTSIESAKASEVAHILRSSTINSTMTKVSSIRPQGGLYNGKIKIIDARTPEEFDGTVIRAARSGHIPTSENIDWSNNLTSDGKLKPNEDLLNLYNLDSDQEIITYCQGAYRAANSFLALKKIGFSNVRVYLGSWGEWGNKTELPIEK